MLAVVYRVDAEAKAKKLSPQKRLELHREKSREVMDDLHRWLKRQFDERLAMVESVGEGAEVKAVSVG